MHGIPLPGDSAPSLKPPFDADTCRVLRDMMRNNVQQTYGQSMFGSLAVCAKSGTAEAAPGQSPHACSPPASPRWRSAPWWTRAFSPAPVMCI